VRETSPRAFIFENVRGLTRAAFADYLRWIVAHLRRPDIIRLDGESHLSHIDRLEQSETPTSYDVLVVQVNAADFGAPQKRHRVIIAGVRRDLDVPLAAPVTTHSRERLLWDQWVTGTYWRRHDIAVPHDETIASTDMPMVRRLRVQETPPGGQPWITVRDAIADLGEPSGLKNHVFQDGARAYPGHTGCLLDQPAKALKAGDHGVPGGENMMVCDDGSVRYFTTREAARLQGLPDTYHFPRSWTESMRQLGNAVPAQLSEAIGHWMAGMLTSADIGQLVAA
jgi:DNA (cytosine-5)-methyltransferase 1